MNPPEIIKPSKQLSATPSVDGNNAEPLRMQVLRDLVAMKTVSSDNEACGRALDYIDQFLTERGMYTTRYEQNGFPSLVATTEPDRKHATVMLTGHVDVVPAPDAMFCLQSVAGNLRGRGVYDMKSAVASYLELVDNLRGDLTNYDFGIMITTDEELGGQDGMKFLLSEGYRTDIAIVPDGGDNWQIQELAKGIQWIKLVATGVAGHASQPWKTENAIHKLLTAIAEVQALVPTQPTEDDPFRTSLSIGLIEGGDATNQAAPHASATLDIRYGNMEDYQSIPAAIKNIAKKHGITAEMQVNDEPTYNSPVNPFIAAFQRIMTKHIGFDPGPSPRFAATDARFFNQLGMPSIIVSPVGGDCHSEKEWVSAASYEQFCNILQEYVVSTSKDTKKQDIAQLARHLTPGETSAHVQD